jgi:hypothetical protein
MGSIFAEKALYGSDPLATNPAKSGRASGSAFRGMRTASCDFISGAVRSSAAQDRSGNKSALRKWLRPGDSLGWGADLVRWGKLAIRA